MVGKSLVHTPFSPIPALGVDTASPNDHSLPPAGPRAARIAMARLRFPALSVSRRRHVRRPHTPGSRRTAGRDGPARGQEP
ncbi:hypothetical protein G443_000192 [Actinoalloteichus cyanogriseus DSM 43889]|uniref:Uncharacterized protein n=1 Tax=Actinoalloteichus caeruleus DSM 43889 TaxID=1120930 RepID=A0ABT1JBP3_ACTCY|nr:hypothetical protein [Actinoalloteichus caeruleus DSM 43889]